MKSWIFLLSVLGILTSNCLGFIVERFGPRVISPTIWSPGQPGSLYDKFISAQIHSSDVQNILRDSEATKSAKEGNENYSSTSEDPQRVKRAESVLNGTTNFSVIVKESTAASSTSSSELPSSELTTEQTAKELESEGPQNVVLLLVKDTGLYRDRLWKEFEAQHNFPVQGSLQKCRGVKLADFSNSSVGTETTYEDCECTQMLRANIASLMSWAREVKEMTTGLASTIDFSIPMSAVLVGPTIQDSRDFEDNDELMGSRIYLSRRRPDLQANSYPFSDPEKQSIPSSPSPTVASSIRKDTVKENNGMWDVFDMFSRIRLAFFRILLESLGNMKVPDEEFSETKVLPRVSHILPTSFAELADNVIEEINKEQKVGNGFIIVAAVPENEINTAANLLLSKIQNPNTLFIVVGLCPKFNDSIPLYAYGPGEKSLLEATTIWELPTSIKALLSKGCQGEFCKEKNPVESMALPSLEVLPLSDEDFPRKQVLRQETKDVVVSNSTTTAANATIPKESKKDTNEKNETNRSAETKIRRFVHEV